MKRHEVRIRGNVFYIRRFDPFRERDVRRRLPELSDRFIHILAEVVLDEDR